MSENLGSGVTLKRTEKRLYAALLSHNELVCTLSALEASPPSEHRATAIDAVAHSLGLAGAKHPKGPKP